MTIEARAILRELRNGYDVYFLAYVGERSIRCRGSLLNGLNGIEIPNGVDFTIRPWYIDYPGQPIHESISVKIT